MRVFVRMAVVACCALSLSSIALAFDREPVKLDRLFTSTAERHELDNIRANFRPGDIQAAGETTAGPQSVTINGVVLRSGGRNVAWVNGRSTVMGPAGEWDLDLEKANTEQGVKVPVALSGTLRTFELQPGQTLETGTGKLLELWQAMPQGESGVLP